MDFRITDREPRIFGSRVSGPGSRILSVAVAVVFAIAIFVCAGCGSEMGADDLEGSAAVVDEVAADDVEQVILSQGYDGYLMIHLDESLGARLDASKSFYSKGESSESSQLLASISSSVKSYSGAELSRSVEADEDAVDARRAELEHLSGMTLVDWNSIYRIDVSDPNEAIKLYRELKDKIGIKKIYPGVKFSLMSLSSTPDLTKWQGYLYSNETDGGLNAKAAWDVGVKGAGVWLVDNEVGFNSSHEDYSLVSLDKTVCNESNVLTKFGCSSAEVAHGTMMLGIMRGLDNSHGVMGMAPSADLKFTDGKAGNLQNLTDGDDTSNSELPPGSIFVTMYGEAGALNLSCSNSNPYGCIPLAADSLMFNAIKQAVAAGVTVITPASNGSVDLDNSSVYESWQKNLSKDDSGVIIVGASLGANHQKLSDSNWGSPVHVYGWGSGVVTSGYPYSGNPFIWNGATSPVPPNTDTNAYFVDNVGGTCPATAMVAGAAALVQSYAKTKSGQATTRYLMPSKMREILVNSGVSQSGSGGNIGKQPRVDQAMKLVDTFLSQAFTQYPELQSNTALTDTKMVALRKLGLGLVCGKADTTKHVIVGPNDPSCPEVADSVLWPIGTGIAKELDFDGDGRADLVQWTNGALKLDLSSKGYNGGDHYNAWDVQLTYTPIVGKWVWPYVEDMNSDTRADLVVYDKEHGKWYIKFTDTKLLDNGTWTGSWDWVLDYSTEWVDDLKLDPLSCTTGTGTNCSNYSRPVPGDYNKDGWIDIGIACSDGYWRVDYGGNDKSKYGNYEKSFQHISNAELALAPGWAYLMGTYRYYTGENAVLYKVPDGIQGEGKIYIYDLTNQKHNPNSNFLWKVQSQQFGGNEVIPLSGDFTGTGDDLGLLYPDGEWEILDAFFGLLQKIAPVDVYGGEGCHPIVADFDGDDYDDRTVMCPDEWRIAYTGETYPTDPDGARRVKLTYDESVFTLPGRPYAGGMGYSQVQQLITLFKETNPGVPPPIPVDMAAFQ